MNWVIFIIIQITRSQLDKYRIAIARNSGKMNINFVKMKKITYQILQRITGINWARSLVDTKSKTDFDSDSEDRLNT